MQNWKIEDKTYFHIFNPKTKKPLTIAKGSIASVTVLADSCAFADALATALMTIQDQNELKVFIQEIKQQHPSVSIWVLRRDND